ncbi:MAG: hypothetical protein IJ558_10790 [Treponema sp.]|nr:hypothetical protein [Treponema sp.]
MSEIKYTESYVAFLDILGFKNLITSKTCADIYSIFALINIGSKTEFKLNDEALPVFNNVKYKIMSDSIILYIDAFIPDAFFALVHSCQRLQMLLLNCNTPILLRGGIAKGGLFSDGDILFGKGLTDAYLIENNVAVYPRIIFTNQLLKEAQKNYAKISPGIDSLSFYKARDEFCCVNFMTIEFFTDFHTSAHYVNNLLSYCQSYIDLSSEPSIREKYLWLKVEVILLAENKKGVLNLTEEGKKVIERWHI